jgi:hypothetical protein
VRKRTKQRLTLVAYVNFYSRSIAPPPARFATVMIPAAAAEAVAEPSRSGPTLLDATQCLYIHLTGRQ